MSSIDKYAIIVAGGSGQRMGSKLPKQFLEIKGRPILIRTLEAYYNYSKELQLILVLPEAHIDTWNSICERYHFHLPLTIRPGGTTRFRSVKNGLEAIKENSGLVAIHDGVRPLVDSSIINDSFEIAKHHGSAIAAIPLKSSIRQITDSGSKALDRQNYRIVQTPQTFKVELIKKAYQIEELPTFTDDASVWEAAGFQVTLFEGSEKNIKITTIHDLLVAEMLMKST
jgi:2-C-methyl-D-erythritol 4-phosphate cytidylyltransferase